jgi:hypothetical protein
VSYVGQELLTLPVNGDYSLIAYIIQGITILNTIFNFNFNILSVISWVSIVLVYDTRETTYLAQVTDSYDHITVVSLTFILGAL